MKCHFCQNELELDTSQPRDSSPHWDTYKSCEYCCSTYGLFGVITALNVDHKVEYAYIHLDKPPYDYDSHTIPDEMFDPPTTFNYIVRLNLHKGTTDIYYYHLSPVTILRLPGFPITPANVREKLKLYLLFA